VTEGENWGGEGGKGVSRKGYEDFAHPREKILSTPLKRTKFDSVFSEG